MAERRVSVKAIAHKVGVTSRHGIKMLRAAFRANGVPLKRGRLPNSPLNGSTPKAYAQYFDATHWAGAAAEWRRLRPFLPLEELGARFGYRSRQHAHIIDRRLDPNARKPRVVRRKPLLRRLHLSPRRARQIVSTCRSKAEVLRKLRIAWLTLGKLVGHGIALPNQVLLQEKELKRRCRLVRILARRGYQASTIAERLRLPESTIYRYNQKYRLGIRLRRSSLVKRGQRAA